MCAFDGWATHACFAFTQSRTPGGLSQKAAGGPALATRPLEQMEPTARFLRRPSRKGKRGGIAAAMARARCRSCAGGAPWDLGTPAPPARMNRRTGPPPSSTAPRALPHGQTQPDGKAASWRLTPTVLPYARPRRRVN